MKLDIKKITSYLKKQKFVVLAYLFDSHAKKKASAMTDLDMALLTTLPKEPAIKKFEQRCRLAGELSMVAGKEVYLVFLEEINERLKSKISENGKLIYEKNSNYNEGKVDKKFMALLEYSMVRYDKSYKALAKSPD